MLGQRINVFVIFQGIDKLHFTRVAPFCTPNPMQKYVYFLNRMCCQNICSCVILTGKHYSGHLLFAFLNQEFFFTRLLFFHNCLFHFPIGFYFCCWFTYSFFSLYLLRVLICIRRLALHLWYELQICFPGCHLSLPLFMAYACFFFLFAIQNFCYCCVCFLFLFF